MFDIALRAPRARVVYLIRATVALPFGPDSTLPSEALARALRQADGVLTVSEYVAQYARQWGGLDARHVPISLLEPGEWPLLGSHDNPYITMVNPCAVKGISIFLALADRFPEARFAAVPTWGTTGEDLAKLRARPNVTVIPPVENMDDVYRQTRIMLVPSIWAEARSRVILEAMSRGIPVMASNAGGLAEAMLGVGYPLPVNPVVHYKPMVDEFMVPVAEIPEQDIAPWEAELARLINDRDHYEATANESRRAALEYKERLHVGPMEEYLLNLLKAPRRPRGPVEAPARPSLSADRQRLLALRIKQKTSSDERAAILDRANATLRALAPNADIEILWDDMWVCRAGPHFFPDPTMFDGAGPKWERLPIRPQKHLRDAGDYWFHVYKPRAGDHIVDIGAGRGEDVFAFSQAVGPAGKVWAIEPHPVSFAALKKFCAMNRIVNVTALNYACVDHPAQLQIETLPVWESNFVRSGEPSLASHPVAGVRFDDLCEQEGIDRIDFLKMNIEGAERFALPGCRKALERADFACVAAHDFRAARGEGEEFRTLEFVRTFLSDAGFKITTRDDDPRYYVPYHVHGSRLASAA
jgi:FkbM family methyltransferase